MKHFLITLITLTFVYGSSLKAEEKLSFGVDAGWGFADLNADDTAQYLANLSGQTITYSEDSGAIMFRLFGEYEIDKTHSVQLGYFFSGDMSATYSSASASATEDYSVNGLDLIYMYTFDDFSFKVGVHDSEVDGEASLTLGGTTYAAGSSTTGGGAIVGFDYNIDKQSYVGFQQYSNVGGDDDSDVIYLSYGYIF